jgi:hypothetical protein
MRTREKIAVVAIVIAVVIGAITIVIINMPGARKFDVSNVSLNPNNIRIDGSATLGFSIKNNDETNPHNVTVVFNVTSVTFYLNNKSLDVNDRGFQYFLMTLQSSEQSTFSFKVTGTLTGGALSSTYAIRLDFYDENSTRFDTETQSLTVNQ